MKKFQSMRVATAQCPRENGFLHILNLLKTKIKPIPKCSAFLCDMIEPKTGVATS
jgi:hypothetical protein